MKDLFEKLGAKPAPKSVREKNAEPWYQAGVEAEAELMQELVARKASPQEIRQEIEGLREYVRKAMSAPVYSNAKGD